jgi:hypothetical protein
MRFDLSNSSSLPLVCPAFHPGERQLCDGKILHRYAREIGNGDLVFPFAPQTLIFDDFSELDPTGKGHQSYYRLPSS